MENIFLWVGGIAATVIITLFRIVYKSLDARFTALTVMISELREEDRNFITKERFDRDILPQVVSVQERVTELQVTMQDKIGRQEYKEEIGQLYEKLSTIDNKLSTINATCELIKCQK